MPLLKLCIKCTGFKTVKELHKTLTSRDAKRKIFGDLK